ncbi:MAG: inosine-5-monophosphate dehydrogenase [Robiginitomaculum sp.]|nr:MAG: inosine-5-monophosphate dehydrogenase [Robiginitomaculum sp.]
MNAEAILQSKGHEVVTINPEDTVLEAAKVLDKNRIGAAVVTEANGKVCGVLSERDVARQVARQGAEALQRPVSESMSRNVITAKLDDSLDMLLSCMTDRRIRHLPVMDKAKLVGVISIGDVVKRKITETEAEAEAMKAYISAG